MANAEQLAILSRGTEAWNRWRIEHPDVTPDLIHAQLRGTDLRGINLSEANIIRASLSGANLAGGDFRRTNLNWSNFAGVDFSGADFRVADLSQANLSNANLRGSNLSEANLNGADLKGANLTDAFASWTVFGNVDLSNVYGLDEVRHNGPSTIGIDTLLRSNGNIPDIFLLGAGLPENVVRYAKALANQATLFHSCFISYSSTDQEFAERLNADLRAKGLRVWFAPEDLKIGDHFQERIDESIGIYDKVMMVLSEASMKSRWVEREVNAALEREARQNRTVLFPIRIDDAIMGAAQPWAADIRRSRHIGDFTRWKNQDAYRKALERLLRDLRAEHGIPSGP